MKDVKTVSGTRLSPIGIGTYGVGGRGHRDVAIKDLRDESVYIPAIIEQLNTGYNFSEISVGYGHGSAARLFSEALRDSGIKKDSVFLTNSVYPRDVELFSTLESDIDMMYELFKTEYFDSTLVTQSLVVKFGYDKIVKKLWDLLETKRTRFVSLSNSNKDLIRKFHTEFEDKLFAHETHLSFEIRECQDEGVFDLTNELDIQTIIWRPLRQGRTVMHNWEPLVRLSKKYEKTENQIVLNWMRNLGFKPEVFSTSSEHICENWDAMQFEMAIEDYTELNNYRVPGYIPPKINWSNMGNGDSIASLASDFEKNYQGAV